MHNMQHVIRIRKIETRAKDMNLSLLMLCRAAGVSYSNVRRWLTGESQPGLLKFNQTVEKLDWALTAARKDLLEKLNKDAAE